jgi:hypothetical protein
MPCDRTFQNPIVGEVGQDVDSLSRAQSLTEFVEKNRYAGQFLR